jgi:hypothetical protein
MRLTPVQEEGGASWSGDQGRTDAILPMLQSPLLGFEKGRMGESLDLTAMLASSERRPAC